eukprot:jgi/Chlat1/390/Chrsp10S01498
MAELQISPSELKFPFELRKQIPTSLHLSNPTSGNVAFKVKTTSPKKYCVRPNTGIIPAGSTLDVQIIMQALREYPPDVSNCKDKFLVQSVPVTKDIQEKDLTPELFSKTGEMAESIREAKLRVMYIAANAPPSPVPEDDIVTTTADRVREKPGPAANSTPSAIAVAAGAGTQRAYGNDAGDAQVKVKETLVTLAQVTEERNAATKEVERLQKELNEVVNKMSANMNSMDAKGMGADRRTTATTGAVAGAGPSVSIIVAILIAVLAFLAGWLLL